MREGGARGCLAGAHPLLPRLLPLLCVLPQVLHPLPCARLILLQPQLVVLELKSRRNRLSNCDMGRFTTGAHPFLSWGIKGSGDWVTGGDAELRGGGAAWKTRGRMQKELRGRRK